MILINYDPETGLYTAKDDETGLYEHDKDVYMACFKLGKLVTLNGISTYKTIYEE